MAGVFEDLRANRPEIAAKTEDAGKRIQI